MKEKKGVDRSKPKEPKGKGIGGKKEDGGKEASKGKAKESKEGGGAVKGGEKKGKKQAKVTKENNKCEKRATTGSQKLNSIARKSSMGISSAQKKNENVVAVRASEKSTKSEKSIKSEKLIKSEKSTKGETAVKKNDKIEVENAGEGNKSLMNNGLDKSRSVSISMSQLKTSTPKRNVPSISSSIGKENAIARYNVSASRGNYSARSDVSVKRMHCTSTICASKLDLNNNEGKIEKKVENKETSVAKLEHKSMILGKIKEETTLGSKEISRISMDEKKMLTLSCKKEASAGKRVLVSDFLRVSSFRYNGRFSPDREEDW